MSGALDWVPARLQETGSAGLSAAVIRDGEVVEARAWGLADTERGRAVSEATLFQAASISKFVTCVGVLRLVARGVVDLDRDVNEYLGRWKVPPVDGWQPRVSLRRLMSHTAGMTVHGFPGHPRDAALPSLLQILAGEPPANTPPVRVDALPGSLWRYSGGGTTIVQLVVEELTRTPLPELMRELVLEPAGMATATYEQPLPEPLHAAAALGYYKPGKPVPGGWYVYPMTAAGGLWCTPTDLCRFAIAFQAALAGQPGALLPRELAEEALRPLGSGLGMEWGLGPAVDERTFGHDGANEGFLSHLVAGRVGGYGCAVMGNSWRCGPLLTQVGDAIAERDGWPGWKPSPAPDGPDPETVLAGYRGRFRTEAGDELEIVERGDGLALVAAGQDPIELQMVDLTQAMVGGLRTVVEFVFPDGAAPGAAPTSALVVRHPGAELRAARV